MLRTVLAAACALAPAAAASAAFIDPPWTRPASDAQATADQTTYQVWESFDPASGAAPNDFDTNFDPLPADFNPNAGTQSVAVSGQFSILGNGNAYSSANPMSGTPGQMTLTVTIPGFAASDSNTRFFLQISTTGSELVLIDDTPTYDFSTFEIDGVQLSSLPDFSYTELSRTSLGPDGQGGGVAVDHAFAFTLPGSAASHVIAFTTQVGHTSVGRLSIDTQVVPAALPEPAGLMLLAGGALLLGRRRRG
jgi:hypothetical protein